MNVNKTSLDDGKVDIQYLKKESISSVVEIHKEVLYEGIAASLGTTFLQVLYNRLVDRSLGLCIVAKKNKEIIGLCVGLFPGAVWRLGWIELLSGNWRFVIVTLFLSILKNPQLLLQFMVGRKKRPQNIELYFLGVTSSQQGKGIGVSLVNRFDRELIKMGEKGYFLITWTGERAERFYFREGFSKLNEATYLGRKISFLWKKLV